jgi:PKD repeat protein
MKKFLPLLVSIFFVNQSIQAQCNAAFTYSVNQEAVNFTGVSTTTPLSHLWFFGDGTLGYGQFGFHAYSQPGVYAVKHIVYDSLGTTCRDSSIQMVAINFNVTCQAFFYSQKDPDDYNYHFFSGSIFTGLGIISYVWTVDGIIQTAATGSVDMITQLLPGSHTVCLAIQTVSGCSSSYCEVIVQPSFCNRNLSFTYIASSINPRQISFTPSPNQSSLKYYWDFGNGYYSSEQMPVHSFSIAGTYSIKLRVYDSLASCIDTVRQNITIQGQPSDSCTASFTYTLNNAGLASFTGVSNQPITSQHWYITNFRDSIEFTATNPSYQFTDTGYYMVCLRLITNTSCDRVYCNYIYVNNVSGRAASSLRCYPNPVSGDMVRINLNMEEPAMLYYKVYNLNGNLVYQSQKQGLLGANMLLIPIQQLNRGQYFVDIVYGEQRKRSIFQKL